ncbi:MAG: hypothetical protein ACN6PC_03800, partial [Pseudomonas putida]
MAMMAMPFPFTTAYHEDKTKANVLVNMPVAGGHESKIDEYSCGINVLHQSCGLYGPCRSG